MSDRSPDRRMLLVGGGGGLVGRALLQEFATDWAIRSLHRHRVPGETRPSVEWVPCDVVEVRDWEPYLAGVDVVVNVAWYRSGGTDRFRPLALGLHALIRAAMRHPPERFVQISVPDAPAEMERDLPYLAYKREIDRALVSSGLPYLLLRPTMLFGPGDRLLTVMLRLMRRYGRFPMFGSGDYHVNPLASQDLAAILRRELALPGSRDLPLGGPRRWRYRDLTDRMWEALGRAPRYWTLSPARARQVARWMERLGSQTIYEYEVDWLMSDLLGLPPYVGLDRPLAPVEPFLDAQAALLGARPQS